MPWLPLWMRFTLGWRPRLNGAIPYLPLQQDFAELLPGQLPEDAFISRVKRVARTAEEFKPERSTMSSMTTGSSVLTSS
jgi:hypothetical protein